MTSVGGVGGFGRGDLFEYIAKAGIGPLKKDKTTRVYEARRPRKGDYMLGLLWKAAKEMVHV